ncbi:MAG: hypothetical protein Q7T55_04670 [Solirubrobacteraceae bacterium]|nr:hypothetical protein [Solirubrobacteraceae bacterium]
MADLAHQARRRRGPLVDRARDELAAGRPWVARAQLHSLLQRDPGHVEGRALLVTTLRGMGDDVGAELVETHRTHGSVRDAPPAPEPKTPGQRVWQAAKDAALFVVLAIVVLVIAGALFGIPLALFVIGLFQLGDWVGLW